MTHLQKEGGSKVIGRVFILRAHQGFEDELDDVNGRLLKRFAELPGYCGGWCLHSREHAREIIRITFWESLDVADKTASDDTVMALRSRLLMIGEETASRGGIYEVFEGPQPRRRRRAASTA